MEGRRGEGDMPSRTLKPMLDQSMVFTGSGGKVMVNLVLKGLAGGQLLDIWRN